MHHINDAAPRHAALQMSACTVEKERFSQRRLFVAPFENSTFSFLIFSLVYDQHLDKQSTVSLRHELKMNP